jgi:hypothetical protein
MRRLRHCSEPFVRIAYATTDWACLKNQISLQYHQVRFGSGGPFQIFHPDCPGAAERNGRSPCGERSSGPYASWNRRVKTEIPDKAVNGSFHVQRK